MGTDRGWVADHLRLLDNFKGIDQRNRHQKTACIQAQHCDRAAAGALLALLDLTLLLEY
jgi:hypothetical protein